MVHAKRLPLNENDVLIVGTQAETVNDLWANQFSEKYFSPEYPFVEAFVVPFPNLAGDIFEGQGSIVTSWSKTSDPTTTPLHLIVQSNLKEALNNDSMKVVLKWKWEHYGKEIFMKQALLYLLFCLVYSTNVVLFSYEDLSSSLHDVYLGSGNLECDNNK